MMMNMRMVVMMMTNDDDGECSVAVLSVEADC